MFQRRRVTWAILLIPFLIASSLPVSADQFTEARSWLERMAFAMREESYQGTFIYVRGDEVETIQLTHLVQDGQVRERMVATSGPQREVLRDEHGVRAILGEDSQGLQHPLHSGSVFPEVSLKALDRARAAYLFEVGEVGRIAGHVAQRVAIIPRDRYRYGYELWLEKSTGLMLRWVLYDADRRSLAKLMFTDLAVGESVDEGRLESTMPEEEFVAIAEAPPALDAPPADADARERKAMPTGFRLAAHSKGEPFEGMNFEHLVFSDGLASVSVYIEPLAMAEGMTQGLSRMGTTNAWSRRAGDWQVTAIGEVPPITVKRIGNAFLASRKEASGR